MLAAIAFGTYFQTVAGFGLGMIALGVASGLQLMPVGLVAVVVSLLTLCNSPLVLAGNSRNVDWRSAAILLAGMAPATFAGIWLLDHLSRSSSILLQLLLGSAITASCGVLAIKPARRATPSSQAGFLAMGGVAGLVGGMFGFSGPPLIFHLYRQPMTQAAVRSTLVLLFACSAAIRTVFVGLQGGFDGGVRKLFAWSVLLVVAATLAGRRYPPPLSPKKIRRIAFAIMALLGISLVVKALASMR